MGRYRSYDRKGEETTVKTSRGDEVFGKIQHEDRYAPDSIVKGVLEGTITILTGGLVGPPDNKTTVKDKDGNYHTGSEPWGKS